MALIPQDILTEIQSRADIVDIVGEYVSLRKKGRNWFGLCPFHGEDTPSFSVNQEKQIYKCFGCGKGGNVFGFLQEIEHLTFGEAAHKLADRYNIHIPEEDLSPEETKKLRERRALIKIHAIAAEFFRGALGESAQAAAYLKKRGVDPETAEKFGIGYSPESDWQALHSKLNEAGFSQELQILSGLVSRSMKNGRCYDKFHGRLIFPIRDAHGTAVAFGGRAFGDDQPKYLNSQTTPIYNKSQLLYGLDVAGSAIEKSRQVIVMEGYMDVVTAHQFGVTNAVASLGTAFTDQQSRLLARYAPQAPEKLQVLLSFDGDGAGAKAALMSLDKLSHAEFADARVLVYPEKKDPDEFLRTYGMKGWQRLLERYQYHRLDYLLYRAEQRHDAATSAGKGAIVGDLTGAIAITENHTEASDFIRRLAQRLNVSEEAIRMDVAKKRGDRIPEPRQVRQYPLKKAGEEKGQLANRHLLIFALKDREIFRMADAELGDSFPSTVMEGEVIRLIRQVENEYDFNPASLFNYIDEENEGLRDFLLKLLDTEIPGTDQKIMAADYIAVIKRNQLQKRFAALQKEIIAAQARGEDVNDLMTEQLRIQRELKGGSPS